MAFSEFEPLTGHNARDTRQPRQECGLSARRDDLVTALCQADSHMTADKTGRTGQQNSHEFDLLIFLFYRTRLETHQTPAVRARQFMALSR